MDTITRACVRNSYRALTSVITPETYIISFLDQSGSIPEQTATNFLDAISTLRAQLVAEGVYPDETQAAIRVPNVRTYGQTRENFLSWPLDAGVWPADTTPYDRILFVGFINESNYQTIFVQPTSYHNNSATDSRFHPTSATNLAQSRPGQDLNDYITRRNQALNPSLSPRHFAVEYKVIVPNSVEPGSVGAFNSFLNLFINISTVQNATARQIATDLRTQSQLNGISYSYNPAISLYSSDQILNILIS